jgi:hypothetical protein
MQYMQSQHQQILHDHPEHQHQHQQHQQPPTLLPPLTPVAGQQYRAQNRPQYAPVSANVSAGHPVRQVTTEQPYNHYYHSNFQQHSQELRHQHQTQLQHHNPVQVKYEFESPPIVRPVEWYSHSQANTQLTTNGHTQSGYLQGSHVTSSSSSHSHGYGQSLGDQSSSHDYNHESTGMHLTRHGEGYMRGGGVQRN